LSADGPTSGQPPSSSPACTKDIRNNASGTALEGQVKKFYFLAMVFALSAGAGAAQTTVADFDNPACSGKSVGVYQGIDFSLSPWECENPGLTGQSGTSISWYRHIYTGQFKLQTPGALLSLNAATSTGSGTLTISTDAGESYSHSINTTFQTLLTGFTKAASVITVKYPGGRTIELDNITYQTGSVSLTPGTLNLSATLTWDDGTPVAGSLNLSQLTGTGLQTALGTFTINSSGSASGTVTIDLTQSDPLTFQVLLLGTNSTAVGSPAIFQVGKLMFPANLTGINAKIILSKSTMTIKSFDMGLVP